MKKVMMIFLLVFFSVAVIAVEESTVIKVVEQQKEGQISPQKNVNEQTGVLKSNTTKTTVNKKKMNKRFIPSEEISEDLGVSFPTDI